MLTLLQAAGTNPCYGNRSVLLQYVGRENGGLRAEQGRLRLRDAFLLLGVPSRGQLFNFIL